MWLDCFRRTAAGLLCGALLLLSSAPVPGGEPAVARPLPGPLLDYVTRPDPSFAWREVERRSLDGVEAIRLALTSQTWRTNIWQHELLLICPEAPAHPDLALLLISGNGKVEKQFSWLSELARRVGCATAVLNRVPNQPLYGGRSEDALIAYTFEQFMRTGDKDWPLLFPMVKSAVRAMDAIQARTKELPRLKLERFVVCGASKRGWTTWLTAAADARVAAISPMVIDMLNMKAQTRWAERVYGRQSEKIKDYTEYDFAARMDEPRMVELRSYCDPYSYRKGYTVPKLLLLGTNDPYWVVDSLRWYWDDLPQPKLVFQTPNAGHDLGGGGQARETLTVFLKWIAERRTLPVCDWTFSPAADGRAAIEMKLDRPARSFRLWTAKSAQRDFRQAAWQSRELPFANSPAARAVIEPAARGFVAYLIEAELVDGNEVYRLSTEARVLPDEP